MRRPRLFRNHDLVLVFVNLKDSASVSGIMHLLEFSAGIETVYSFSGVISVLMSDVTLVLLFLLIDVRIVKSGFKFFSSVHSYLLVRKKVNFLCRCEHRKFSFTVFDVHTTRTLSQRLESKGVCSDKNPTALAPNVRTFAAKFRSA